MEERELKALQIAARAKLRRDGDDFIVHSLTSSREYRVHLDPDSCSCNDFEIREKPCKHVLGMKIVREREGGEPAPVIDTSELPKKKTYKQNWPAYKQAQNEEKWRFQKLLHELCSGLDEPRPKKRGRPPVPMSDMVFASVFKVYSTLPALRFGTDFEAAYDEGYLSRKLHANSIAFYLEKDELTPILQNLITVTSLPFSKIETKFAPDSSGFSVSRFERWFDHKYGEQKMREWVKVHIMTGTQTHIVTAAEIHDKNANDSPIYRSLLAITARHFKVEEVAADLGYISVENLEATINELAYPYIPFKSNATDAMGGIWAEMFHYFCLHRNEFLEHYHKRSNVESVFSAVKRKFSDNIRSKTDVAMKNEAFCKFICHNICQIIQHQVEMGLEARFWGDGEPGDNPEILPFRRPAQ